jgi:hypothetical protein
LALAQVLGVAIEVRGVDAEQDPVLREGVRVVIAGLEAGRPFLDAARPGRDATVGAACTLGAERRELGAPEPCGLPRRLLGPAHAPFAKERAREGECRAQEESTSHGTVAL